MGRCGICDGDNTGCSKTATWVFILRTNSSVTGDDITTALTTGLANNTLAEDSPEQKYPFGIDAYRPTITALRYANRDEHDQVDSTTQVDSEKSGASIEGTTQVGIGERALAVRGSLLLQSASASAICCGCLCIQHAPFVMTSNYHCRLLPDLPCT